MKENKIVIRGAKTHNLKNISLEIPKNSLTIITGLSGSGKSSLAFDTIFVEGQRRYIASLSSYVKQFIGQLEKPPVEFISGLSPAIAINQKGKSYNPRSTVGTMTEIYDYLRVLFARLGTPFCPKCNSPVKAQTIQEIVDIVLSWEENSKIIITAPLVKHKKGEFRDLFDRLKKEGYQRIYINGEIYNFEEDININKNKIHNIYLIIDRLKVLKENSSRISESIELALKKANKEVIILKEKEEFLFSETFSCPKCEISFENLEPKLFSFNSPVGACPDCDGLGEKMDFDIDLLVPDKTKSILQGAIKNILFGGLTSQIDILKALANHFNFDINTSFEKLPEKIKNIIFFGTEEIIKFSYGDYIFSKNFDGLIPILWKKYKNINSDEIKSWYEKFMKTYKCLICNGNRLKKESLGVKILDKNIIDISNMQIKDIKKFFVSINDRKIFLKKNKIIAEPIIKEILNRLNFLIEVGLEYLTLMRKANTLSGGETQRINLATQIGLDLEGVLYILDEPSIGLHQRDNQKLINTMKRLKNNNNTVIVVEHDEETIRNADYIIDIGPGAGSKGGEVVAIGSLKEILVNKKSLTAKYLKGELKIEVPNNRRKSKKFIRIFGAEENNLKNIDVKIPLGVFVSISGVSGSGNSTLIENILYNAVYNKINYANRSEGKYKKIIGLENINKIINIDQTPIGKTPRSNPATYTDMFTYIRQLFSEIIEAKSRGYLPGRFSFNKKGGRCEACQGDGEIKIEMNFLPDIYVECDICKGKRFNKETLEIKYKGKNISDVLNMTIEEADNFFEKIPKISKILKVLISVGLGYIKLGQNATTLSGGEAQRIKLATELSKTSTGKTLYILDEPTTGLHFDDINKLILVLQKLVDKGNSIIIIEHNLDILKISDYIIDLGPEGGDNGGMVVAEGTPEEIIKNKNSYTGQYLKSYLNDN